jgi:CheY-like chemotaxis protein
MRLRMCLPPRGAIDGIALDHFRPGCVYDVSMDLAAVLVAEGWAVPVLPDDTDALGIRGAGRLLVVDDDTQLRHLTVAILTKEGYEVLEARNGRDALALLCQYFPDLVILDLEMPVMDGHQFRTHQQQLGDPHLATIPVLLLTGENIASQPVPLNAVALVRKPFAPTEFVQAVMRALPTRA